MNVVISCKYQLKLSCREEDVFMNFDAKKPVNLNKTIRMNEVLIDKLTMYANEKDISFNQLVVQCCEYALSNIKDNSFSSTGETDK